MVNRMEDAEEQHGDNHLGREAETGSRVLDPGLTWASGSVHLATVTRGGETDTVHFGMACLVDAEGKVVWSLGDPAGRAFFRSSAKPIQALPVLACGAADAYGLEDADLALLCGSHKGGPEQVRQVRSILARCGLEERHLGCGDGLADQCSGKHAGMLAGCRHLGLPLEDYLNPEHPWQRAILETLGERCDIDSDDIVLAEDGCSAPTFSMPLYNMALGFARMGREAAERPTAPDSPARLFRAMVTTFIHTGEPDMRAFPIAPRSGRGNPHVTVDDVPVTKGGANGLHCAALPSVGLGFALKIADGSAAARWPVFIGALERSGLIDDSAARLMHAVLWPPISTRKGRPAGELHLAF